MPAERLDTYLVRAGLARTRSQARDAIRRGTVRLNGAPARRPAQTVPDGASVEAEIDPLASRAGHKLAGALDHFDIDPSGAQALDVGASTGGFTDVLLRRGVAAVAAVDVGRGQLAESIAANPRVTVLDGLNARHLAAHDLPFAPTLIVMDLSFISLTLVLPAVLPLAAAPATLVALIKPQFEVGRAAIGKGGIVKDRAAVEEAVTRVSDTIAAAGFAVIGTIASPIAGGDGNQEYLVAAVRAA